MEVRHVKRKTLGQSTEADVAAPFFRRHTFTLGTTLETDSAGSWSGSKLSVLAQLVELDLAFAFQIEIPGANFSIERLFRIDAEDRLFLVAADGDRTIEVARENRPYLIEALEGLRFEVEGEDHTFVILAEDHTYSIPVEDRTYVILPETRVYVVQAEGRELIQLDEGRGLVIL